MIMWTVLLLVMFCSDLTADHIFFTPSKIQLNDPHISSKDQSDDYTNEPDYVKPVYHHPNAYELEPYKFWKRAEALPHFHGDTPAAGRLHQHYPPYRDSENFQHFITDPPGVGLNSYSNGYNNINNNNNSNNRSNNNNNNNNNNYDNNNNNNNNNTDNDNKNDSNYDGLTAELGTDAHHQKTTEDVKSKIIDFDIENMKRLGLKPSDLNPQTNEDGATGNEYERIAPRSKPLDEDNEEFVVHLNSPVDGYSDRSMVGRRCCSCCFNSPYSGGFVGGHAVPTSYNNNCGDGCSGNAGGGCNVGCSSCCPTLSPCCFPQLPCCPRIQIPFICCQPNVACGICRSKTHRSLRTKRFGCIPCLRRQRRDINFSGKNDDGNRHEKLYVRQKRLTDQCDRSCCDYSECEDKMLPLHVKAESAGIVILDVDQNANEPSSQRVKPRRREIDNDGAQNSISFGLLTNISPKPEKAILL